jgi:hypothetical protein
LVAAVLEDLAMATKKAVKPVGTVTPPKATDLLKIGDRVRIRHYDGQEGRIVEFRGPLGPGGARIYRVRIQRKPTPTYIELREDQLELIPASA